MNFERSLIFAYLEEDNTQRAYFRVRPLLTSEGDIRQDAVSLWPNEGGLRIVPDRNEQHTFKTRMRTLGSYCVVDLRGQPAEAGKIRTNKNFKPERGEVNQYILYSDTVFGLPAHTFYQLVDGKMEDYVSLSESAITPLFFIRHEDTLYGPVKKSTPEQPQPAAETSAVIFDLDFPDGVTRSILYINDEPPKEPLAVETLPEEHPDIGAAADDHAGSEEIQEAIAAESDEPLPIGEKLQFLDMTKSHDDTLEQLNKPVSADANLLRHPEPKRVDVQESNIKRAPLNGTPLIKTPLHVSVQQTKNRTQEFVSSQWSVGKYESPAQNLPAGTKLRSVENPVESACQHLREAWNASGSHDQLLDFILSLQGIQHQLETKMCAGKTGTMLQRVLQQRLQDLEAERLSALCELDKAKRDVDAYKQELLSSMATRIARDIGQLETDKQKAQQQIADLKREENALLLQKNALLSKIEEIQKLNMPEAIAKLVAEAHMMLPVSGVPLRITPVSGYRLQADELIDRMLQVCTESGVAIDRNYAVAILVLLAVSPRIGVSCATPAAASTLLKNIAVAMGWQNSCAHQYTAEQQPVVGIRPVDSTPAILATNLPNYAALSNVTKILTSRNTSTLIRNPAFDVNQWPILMLPPLAFVPELDGEKTAVSASSLEELVSVPPLHTDELDAVLKPVLQAGIPLSGAAQKEMYRFVSTCAALMEGGLPAAVDWGILLWIIPALEHGSKHYASVKALLDEYPLSRSRM